MMFALADSQETHYLVAGNNFYNVFFILHIINIHPPLKTHLITTLKYQVNLCRKICDCEPSVQNILL